MSPVTPKSLIVLASLLVLAGCGGQSPRSVAQSPAATVTVTSTPIATATATPAAAEPTAAPTADSSSCAEVLGPNKARELAGGPVKDPYKSTIGNLSGCRWDRRDGSAILGAASMPARQWVAGLPSVIDTARSLLEQSRRGRQAIKLIESKLASGSYSTNARACELFRILVNAQYSNIPKDSDVVVTYYPSRGTTLGVVGQACVNGRFWSLAWTEPGHPVKDRERVAARLEDALLKASLG